MSAGYKIGAAEMEIIVCLARTGTLAEAGARLNVDGSTVFRALQRIEKGLGQRLFERSRSGYQATDLALQMIKHGERIEFELEAVRSLINHPSQAVSGTVRITTTEALCYGMLLRALCDLSNLHPQLKFDINSGNDVLNLTKRDADIALRATKEVPDHLVGKQIGMVRVCVYCLQGQELPSDPAHWRWIALDESVPDHPTVWWRKQHFPQVKPVYTVSSIVAVMEAILQGIGVGLVPLFLARAHPQLKVIMATDDDASYQLWLLTHPESRHLRRISTVFQYLATHLQL